MKITDEILSAFIDNELSPSEYDKVVKALEADPVLQQRLDDFVQDSWAFEKAISSLCAEDLPASVQKALDPVASQKANHTSWGSMAIAAMMLVTISAGVGHQYGLGQSTTDSSWMVSEINADHNLYAALQTASSGMIVDVDGANDTTIKPILSFSSDDGHLCRQFVVSERERSFEAVACKSEASWSLVALGQVPHSAGDTFHTASGTPSPAVEAAVDNLISASLSDDEENKAIQAGWQSTPIENSENGSQ